MKIFIFLFIIHCAFTIGQTQSSWFWQNPLPQGNDLCSVCFINGVTGWAVGGAGTILKTTNGGNNWTLQPSVS